MKELVIADTGPLVAFLNRRERRHNWAREQFAQCRPPLLTCESVLSEACFLLRDLHQGIDSLMELLHRQVLALPFRLADEQVAVDRLLKRYRDVPMSLADACLVRMSEQLTHSAVLTLDRDFRLYRKDGRKIISVLMPPEA